MRRKYEQIKNYAKIVKYKRGTGETEEMQLKQQPQSIDEEHMPEEVPKNEDFEDPFEDEFEEEEAWVSDSEGEAEEGENESGTMMS